MDLVSEECCAAHQIRCIYFFVINETCCQGRLRFTGQCQNPHPSSKSAGTAAESGTAESFAAVEARCSRWQSPWVKGETAPPPPPPSLPPSSSWLLNLTDKNPNQHDLKNGSVRTKMMSWPFLQASALQYSLPQGWPAWLHTGWKHFHPWFSFTIIRTI